MVQQALNRHSRIAIPPETKYFFSFLGHSRAAQQRHVRRLNDDLGIRLPVPPSPVRTAADARSHFDLMARTYVERFPEKNVSWFGEKTPEHTGHMARIAQVFPRARFVVLYRDGRDVALSLAKAPWMPGGLYVGFLIWLYYQRLVAAARAEISPNVYFVRYEDVVADPEREFRGVLDFLGLPYEPAVALGHGNSEGIPAREFAWKSNALGPITTERVGTFQRELNSLQLGVLERLGRRTLEAFGYPLVTNGQCPLAPGLLLQVSFDAAAFAWRLPWYSLARELGGRVRGQLGGVADRCRHLFRYLRLLPRLAARRAEPCTG